MDVSGDYHPRSRKRSKGVQKSGRSHAIVIREDGDLQSQTKRKSLMSRVRHFLRKFDRQPSFEEQEREVYIRKIKMNDQGGGGEGDAARGAGSANPPNIPEGPYSSADFDLNDTVRTAVTDYTDASSTARSLQGLRGPKLDWWFPAKAAFGRKKDVAVEELFDRLTRPSMNTNTKIDSFLLRDSVDADKIETRQSKWIDRGKGYFHKQVSERARPGNSSSQNPDPDDTILVCRLHFPQRRKNKQAALVETGVHAGRSLVKLAGIRNMTWHRLRHDAFSSLISMHFSRMILMVVGAYVFAWLLFSLFWWSAFLAEPQCVTGTSGWLDALIMSISTANTIGYGMRAIKVSQPIISSIFQYRAGWTDSPSPFLQRPLFFKAHDRQRVGLHLQHRDTICAAFVDDHYGRPAGGNSLLQAEPAQEAEPDDLHLGLRCCVPTRWRAQVHVPRRRCQADHHHPARDRGLPAHLQSQQVRCGMR